MHADDWLRSRGVTPPPKPAAPRLPLAEARHARRVAAVAKVTALLEQHRKEKGYTPRKFLARLPDPCESYSPEEFNAFELTIWRLTKYQFRYVDWRFAARPGKDMRADPNQRRTAGLIADAIAGNGIEPGRYVPASELDTGDG